MSDTSLAEKLAPRLESFKFTLYLLVKNPASAFGLAVVLAYVAIALIVQFDAHLLGINSSINHLIPNFVKTVPTPPSFSHPFGTTYPGIDLFQGILKAIRIDLAFTFVVVLSGAIIGVVLGVVSAYKGGWTDEIMMRVTDIFFSIPFLVFAIALGFFLGRTMDILALGLILIWWPVYARVVRGQVLSIREQTYVEAARSSGVSETKIMFKHIVPNTLAPIFVQVSLDLASVAILLATLNFIGFSPAGSYLPELGYLSSIGYEYAVIGDWWTIFFPGFALLLFAISMNLFGDGLRDALDPKMRR